MKHFDVAILGGGASGMTAAITMAQEAPHLRILLLERKERLGKKLLATGNGRCNLSNRSCEHYLDTLDFLGGIGLVTRTEEASGRIYPFTESAADVVWMFERAIELHPNIRVLLEAEVTSLESFDGKFLIAGLHAGKPVEYEASRVLISMGGKAGPAFGTTGDGFRLARKMGHHVTRLAPALTAIETREDLKKLAGIRAKCSVELLYQGESLRKERGEVQFTKYGVSGICIFNLSSLLVIPEGRGLRDGFDDYELRINFVPEIDDFGNYYRRRRERLANFALRSLVASPLADWISKKSEGDIEKEVSLLQGLTLHPSGTKGWDFAQVTRGGVPYQEIDEITMQSKLCPGLFFAGEVLDYVGDCGGFNLEHAWETGRKAGKGMVR